jgi:hypothetical protein
MTENEPMAKEEYWMPDDEKGGVRSTSVSITLNAKSLGVDAFIKVEQTQEFVNPVSADEAKQYRVQMGDALTSEALTIVETTAKQVKEYAAANPRGATSVHDVRPAAPAPAGVQAGTQVSGDGAAAVVAVANGASHSQEWLSCPSRFGDGDLRFLSTASYPQEQMEADVANWLRGQGMNPAAFKVWDNRGGPKGMEAGVPQGSVANVKIDKALVDDGTVPDEFSKVPAARVKFNNNGSLYVWFTKQFEGYSKYSLADQLKG